MFPPTLTNKEDHQLGAVTANVPPRVTRIERNRHAYLPWLLSRGFCGAESSSAKASVALGLASS